MVTRAQRAPSSFQAMGCGASLPSNDAFLSTPLAEPVTTPLVPATTSLTTVAMKQKFLSISGGDFNIKDKEGNLVAILDGKNMSMRERSVLLSPSGEPVACILEKILAMSPAYFVYAFSPRCTEMRGPTHDPNSDALRWTLTHWLEPPSRRRPETHQ